MTNFPLNLVLCFNESYVSPALVSACSYLQESKLDVNLIFIIDESVTRKSRCLINKAFSTATIIKVNSAKVRSSLPALPTESVRHISSYYIKKAARNEFLSFWTKAEEGYCVRIQTSSVI